MYYWNLKTISQAPKFILVWIYWCVHLACTLRCTVEL
jgi:hypothetical protein